MCVCGTRLTTPPVTPSCKVHEVYLAHNLTGEAIFEGSLSELDGKDGVGTTTRIVHLSSSCNPEYEEK